MRHTIRGMVRESRMGKALIAFMVLGFTALLIAGFAAAYATGQSQKHAAAVAHTYQVEIAFSEARRLIEQGETTRRGYMLNPATELYRQTFLSTAGQLTRAMDRLGMLTQDNPLQRRHIRLVNRLLDELRTLRERSILLVANGRSEAAIQEFRSEQGAARLRLIRRAFDAMSAEEQRLLMVRDAEQARGIAIFYAILTAAGVLLVAVAAAALLVVMRYTRDLSRSRDALSTLNDNLEEIVAERTEDLSRANEEIQRFAYIVSHDLRSPLVNVMGFTAELEAATGALTTLVDRVEAETPALLTEDARLAAREDLPEAIGFIRTSTQKMDRLINAILTLSRQGRRVLTPERLDTEALVGSIRDTLAHRLDEKDATIVIQAPLPPIVSDRLAIEQILSNLIENAVKYSHPQRPGWITVSGGTEGTRTWYDVADNGRGIDPRDHQRVFDLFRRSGTQDQPGEGIGLAHVRALAYRLGGTIDVRSVLGEGATFRLTLPKQMELQEVIA